MPALYRQDSSTGPIRYHCFMDTVPPPVDGESRRQDLQRAQRRQRRRFFLRRAGLALVAIVVLAAVGYGLFSWLGDDAQDAAEAMNVGATSSEVLPTGSSPSSNGADATSGSTGVGTAGGVTSASSLSATTTTTLANLPPQELTVETNPEITNLQITLQDGTVLTGKTPFS